MLVLSLVACLLAAWLGSDVLAGIGFCAGCVLAPIYARREAQLQIVVSAPVIFLAAVVVTQALTAQGNSGHGRILSVLEGTLLTLAGVAPWLFAGTIACIGMSMLNGLQECVRELRSGGRELRSGGRDSRPGRGPGADGGVTAAARRPSATRAAGQRPSAQALSRLPPRW